MLITISGPDGTGKTTQSKMLLKYFENKGYTTASVSDILDNFDYESGNISDLTNIYDYLKNYDVVHTRFRLHSRENAKVMDELEVSPLGNFKLATLSAYTSYYDQIQWNKYINEPLLNSGKILLCDKYAYDDIAFKATFGCQYEWMKKVYYDLRIPQIAFYMDVNPETIIERNISRPDGRIVFYDNLKNTRRLKYYYDRLVEDYNIIKLDGNDSPKNIQAVLLQHLEKLCIK